MVVERRKPEYECKQVGDGWNIFFRGNDTGIFFTTQVEGLGWIYKTLLMLQTDAMMFGEWFQDSKTGERIDPMTVTITEVAK